MSRWGKAALIAAVTCVVACAGASGARADFRPVGIDFTGVTVLDYGAAGVHHIAALRSGQVTQILVSADGGRSFAPLAAPPGASLPVEVSVEPDGRRWATVLDAGGVHAFTAESVGPWMEVRTFADGFTSAAPVVTPAGRLLAIGHRVPGQPSATHVTLHRIAADGSDLGVLDVAQPSTVAGLDLTPDAQGAWLRTSTLTWRIDASGQLTPQPAWTPDVSALGADVRLLGRRLYRTKTAEVWWPVADPIPKPINDVTAVDGGLLIEGTLGGTSIGVLSDPQTLASLGPLALDTQKLIDASNGIRAEQSLPPLIGDPVVSVAARNHALYDRRWHEAHNETPGREGFTGSGPFARCQAVGATCVSEIMHSRAIAESVADWWATPLHRQITASPNVIAAGGGFAQDAGGSTAVMDGGPNDALVVAPIGLPRGSWGGQLGFIGEIPDPGVACGIHAPYGVAVTAYSYVDPATGEQWRPGVIALVDESAVGAAVRGCATDEFFLPDDEVKPGHTYRASTAYTTAGGGVRPYTWTFVPTTPARDSQSAASGRTPASRCLSIARRPGRISRRALRVRGIAVTVRSCAAGAARVELRRGPRIVAGKRLRLFSGRARIVRVRARGIRAGRVTLRAVQGGRRASTTLTVRR